MTMTSVALYWYISVMLVMSISAYMLARLAEANTEMY